MESQAHTQDPMVCHVCRGRFPLQQTVGCRGVMGRHAWVWATTATCHRVRGLRILHGGHVKLYHNLEVGVIVTYRQKKGLGTFAHTFPFAP